MCSGYYSYEEGHHPRWPGEEAFAGTIVHPQFWPEELDTQGKSVAVIGSGATAVTLVPALARTAGHVTMVQRSPSYVAPRPSRDRIAAALKRVLPLKTAAGLTRWKNVAVQQFFFRLARRRPAKAKAELVKMVAKEIGESQARHFTPTYNPWDQRLCLAPDGDLFAAINAGTASVVTGVIDRFTPSGLMMADGTEVSADIVVTATGLKVKAFGDLAVTVDGEPVDVTETMAYKGLMLSGLPNFVYTIGYTNASWTLKADLVGDYVVRLLRHMDEHGYDRVEPVRDETVSERPFMDLSSGYVQRALPFMPKQGDRAPWMLKQNYLVDTRTVRRGRIDDGVLAFS
jgi:monooxygenase